jgi:hypothetical protein
MRANAKVFSSTSVADIPLADLWFSQASNGGFEVLRVLTRTRIERLIRARRITLPAPEAPRRKTVLLGSPETPRMLRR